MSPALWVVAAMATSCGSEPGPAPLDQDSAILPAAASDSGVTPGASDAGAFSERVVVFMEATAEEIEQVGSGVPEDDFYVIADDLMYYRASAHEYFEAKQLKVVRLEGRRPLTFTVDGAPRRYDYSDFESLDLVVLFDPGREPLALAPAAIHLVDGYFGAPSSP